MKDNVVYPIRHDPMPEKKFGSLRTVLETARRQEGCNALDAVRNRAIEKLKELLRSGVRHSSQTKAARRYTLNFAPATVASVGNL